MGSHGQVMEKADNEKIEGADGVCQFASRKWAAAERAPPRV